MLYNSDKTLNRRKCANTHKIQMTRYILSDIVRCNPAVMIWKNYGPRSLVLKGNEKIITIYQ